MTILTLITAIIIAEILGDVLRTGAYYLYIKYKINQANKLADTLIDQLGSIYGDTGINSPRTNKRQTKH